MIYKCLFFVAQLLDELIITHSVVKRNSFVLICVILFHNHTKGADMTTFDRIKEISRSRGMNLKQVAKAAGLSENAIYRYNQGVEPSAPTIKAIADALSVSSDFLEGKTDDPDFKNSNKPKVAELLDEETILAFDGLQIDAGEKEKILDYARYVIEQRQRGNK